VSAPYRWPKYMAGTRRYVLPTFPFSLLYFAEDDAIAIVALASESRRPGYGEREFGPDPNSARGAQSLITLQ